MNNTIDSVLSFPPEEELDASVAIGAINLMMLARMWVMKIKKQLGDRIQSNENKVSNLERRLNRYKSRTEGQSAEC